MASSNQLKPHLVNLAGGLDFVTPKLLVEPGKLINGYNFEVSDRLGYKRIDGITPFDGRVNAAKVYSNTIYIRYSLDVGVDPDVGEYVKLASAKEPGLGPVARVFAMGTPEVLVMAVIVTDYSQLFSLQVGLSLSTLDGTNTYTILAIGGTELLTGTSYDTEAEKFDQYVTTYAEYEDTITGLPAGRVLGDPVTYTPATGMTWYKDRLHLTQDLSQLSFANGDVVPQGLLPNDVIDTSAGTFRVLSVHLLEGSYGEMDAGGIALVTKLTGTWPTSQVGANVLRNGVNVGGADVASEALTASVEDAWLGGMFRSKDITQASNVHTDQGWEFVDTGFVFDYKEGQAYGTPPLPPPLPGREINAVEIPVNTASPELTFSAGTTTNLGTVWTLEGGASSIVDALEAADGVKFLRSPISSNYGNSPTTTLTMSTVNLDEVPDDAVLLGIEVGIRGLATAFGVPNLPQTIAVQLSTANSVSKNTAPLTGAFADYTVGGANDLWGSSTLDMKTLRSGNVSIKITPNYRAQIPGVDGYVTDLDYAYLKVHYQITVSQLFFWDGTDDVTGTVMNYSTENEEGLAAWQTGDAKGQMHATSLRAVSPGNRTAIMAGDEVRTAAGGLGTLVAVVESTMDFAGVPSFNSMLDEGARSEIIVANFYGIDEWEAMYAVNGAGRAWTYDSYYFRYLYTGLPLSSDKPRHVEFFKHHLALSYKSGNVTLSAAGEPTNFFGVDGAASLDVGDRVTALGRLNGDVLAVYCESSVHGLSGTNVDDFTAKILNSSEGAIEYTFVDMGGKHVYCAYSGLSTFQQTDAYGDFLGSRLSASISPWLIPRLSGKASAINWTRDETTKETTLYGLGNKPVCAYAVKRKNQYRLVFDDGSVLTMTLFGAEQIPVFTIHRIYDGDSRYDSNFPLVPFSLHNSVDKDGVERIHMSSYSPLDDTTKQRFCYEIDQGWLYRSGTATNTIHGQFTLTNNFLDNPFEFKTLKKLRAHGMTNGRGEYKAAVSSEYVDQFPDSLSDTRWQPLSMPRDATMDQFGAGDYRPVTNIVDLNGRGTSLSVRIREVPVNQPPVIFQTLLMQLTDGTADK